MLQSSQRNNSSQENCRVSLIYRAACAIVSADSESLCKEIWLWYVTATFMISQ